MSKEILRQMTSTLPTPPPNQQSIFRPGLICLTKCPALRWDILTKQAYYLLTLILQTKK